MAEETNNKQEVKAPKKKPQEKTYKHTALINKRIGSNPDGTAKTVITKNDTLHLTKKQEESYRKQNIIK